MLNREVKLMENNHANSCDRFNAQLTRKNGEDVCETEKREDPNLSTFKTRRRTGVILTERSSKHDGMS